MEVAGNHGVGKLFLSPVDGARVAIFPLCVGKLQQRLEMWDYWNGWQSGCLRSYVQDL